jgi:hypothetical protein
MNSQKMVTDSTQDYTISLWMIQTSDQNKNPSLSESKLLVRNQPSIAQLNLSVSLALILIIHWEVINHYF